MSCSSFEVSSSRCGLKGCLQGLGFRVQTASQINGATNKRPWKCAFAEGRARRKTFLKVPLEAQGTEMWNWAEDLPKPLSRKP